MAITVKNVGHVVLKVQDIERSARFYRDVLGLKEVARGNFGRPMAFFSTGDRHSQFGRRRSLTTLLAVPLLGSSRQTLHGSSALSMCPS